MNCEKKHMLLYAVTDRSWTGRQTLIQQVESALAGGITCLQLREKTLSEKEFLLEACEIRELCHHYKVPLIINDNVKIAVEAHADGVHVGQKDMEAVEARKLLKDHMILGVSTRTVQQAMLAESQGADYLGVGAVFGSSTKKDARPLDHQILRDITSAVSIPVCAIGGITRNNILQLSGTGIDGVALVSAIFASSDIKKECEILRSLSEQMIKECK